MSREICIFQDFLTDAHKAKIQPRPPRTAGFDAALFPRLPSLRRRKACLQHCEVLYAHSR